MGCLFKNGKKNDDYLESYDFYMSQFLQKLIGHDILFQEDPNSDVFSINLTVFLFIIS